MRRVPSCLLLASFLLCFGCVVPDSASAETRARHSTPVPAPAHHVSGTQSRHITSRGVAFRHGAADRRFRSGRALPFKAHRFFPQGPLSWPYMDTSGELPITADESPITAPPGRVIGIPSLADLPASTGIGRGPAASPTIYVLNGAKRSLRHGSGAKILTMNEADPQLGGGNSGPRIIHLDVPRGR